ncbi:MAG: MFS transporter [Candidatus Omnitrophica bacterium]|nr:MFS transporter [Candidatus Omnitrophota bacterium]
MKKATQVIILFGLVSLFGDLIYEGARSINGPYLETLGASAAAVGFFMGFAEFCSYGVRLVSGFLSDRSKSYWLFIFIGYGLLIAVPLMSLTGIWQTAVMFIILERIGKALRGPARDTVVSMASSKIGTGLGFGITEVLDQLGAVAGPLILTGSLLLAGGGYRKGASAYQSAYALMWFPLVVLMACVAIAYFRVKDPTRLEHSDEIVPPSDKLPRIFWLYTAFTFVSTTGFVNAVLVGYHFKIKGMFADAFIPLLYAIAMAADAIAAIVIGKAYDIFKNRRPGKTGGLSVLIAIPILTMMMMPCVFSGSQALAIFGMVLWGVIMGAHETVMRSGVADLTHLKKRGTGYGIFNTSYGLALFAGGALMGLLYGISLAALITAAVVIECAALAVFLVMRREAIARTV